MRTRIDDALRSSFTEDDLERVLLMRLERALGEYRRDGWPATRLEVVSAAEREGWLPALLRALAAERAHERAFTEALAELVAE